MAGYMSKVRQFYVVEAILWLKVVDVDISQFDCDLIQDSGIFMFEEAFGCKGNFSLNYISSCFY